MFHRADSPAFLIQEPIINDAADSQFGVLLDRIIFQVLVAPIPIDQEFPVWLPVPDATTEGQGLGCRFQIQRFVILDNANCFGMIQTGRFSLNWFQEKLETQRCKKSFGLVQVGSILDGESEGFQARWVQAHLQKAMISDQKNSAAIDAA